MPDSSESEPSRRPDTTRDQRRDAQLMRRLGYTQSAISRELGLSLGQVQYALSHAETPITRPGRPSKLSEAQVEELKAFMAASPANERMPYGKIPQALGWDVGEYCIRHALRKLGYKRPAGGGRRRSVNPAAQSAKNKSKSKRTGDVGAAAEAEAEAGSVSVSVSASPSVSAVGAASSAASVASPVAAASPSPAAPSAASAAAPVPGPEPDSGAGDEAEAELGGGTS